MPEGRSHDRIAFTLIELVVVMVILGILAALVANSLSGVVARQQLSRAAQTIEMFDAKARREARRRRLPTEALIDRTRGRLTIDRIGRGDNGSPESTYRLPRQVKIKEVRMRRQGVVGTQVEIDINRFGQSPTYAVELQRGETSRWLVVLGLTGQVISLDSEGEADAILSL